MSAVFVLQHQYETEEGEEEGKMIGVYTSREEAFAAIARLRGKPGFAQHPDGFSVDEYELNEDHWTEGFVRE